MSVRLAREALRLRRKVDDQLLPHEFREFDEDYVRLANWLRISGPYIPISVATHDLVAIAVDLSNGIEDDVSLHRPMHEADKFAGRGTCVLERSVMFGDQPFKAFRWSVSPHGARMGVGVTGYMHIDNELHPLPPLFWRWDQRLDESEPMRLPGALGEFPHAGWGEASRGIFKFAMSLWHLAAEPRIVDATPFRDHKSKRSLSRRGVGYSDVSVLSVRPTRMVGKRYSGPTGRQVAVRSFIRPHFKHVVYGPGRSCRRLQLIAAHVRGPQDAPLVIRERVGLLQGDAR